MIAGDSTGYHISPSNSGNGAGGVGPVGSNFIRHGGVINAVFIDGHVEATGPTPPAPLPELLGEI